ncbi:MAG: alpha/beta hydrolase, partial [Desulfobacteraceae bacterium]|nr:alpha/beta hydrolase [Desulfobacteraceae bacterium]
FDYTDMDREEILNFVFHPRQEFMTSDQAFEAKSIMVPVADGVAVHGMWFLKDKLAPTILFFHGNGEIVSDYDDIGLLYNSMDINFFIVDYRGYGRSEGRPTVTSMLKDSIEVFDFVKTQLKKDSVTGPFVVMGRSLGSASALEIALKYENSFDGLIIESGFAHTSPLFNLLSGGVPGGFNEDHGFHQIEKIAHFTKPLLVIHSEYDHIIPFSDSEDLISACKTEYKKHVKIPNANHNTIFQEGLSKYMEEVKSFITRL